MEHTGFKDIPQDVKPVGPNIGQQAINLIKAAPGLIISGFKMVPEEVYEERMTICRTCHFWDENGNLGVGKCLHEKCGCSKGKMRMADSVCPIMSWGKYGYK